MRKYFVSARKYFDNLAFQIEVALQDFMYHLKHELTIESIKTKVLKKKDYVKEKMSDFKDNVSCLRTRIKVALSEKYVWIQKLLNINMEKYGHQLRFAVTVLDTKSL